MRKTSRRSIALVSACALGLTGLISGVVYSANAASTAACQRGTALMVPVTAINVGGPAVQAGGITWKADTGGQGGHTWTNPSSADIADTDLDTIYRSERAAPQLSYEIPVPNDSYLVRLHMAELWWDAEGGAKPAPLPGRRVESFTVEGKTVINGLNLGKQAAGPLKAFPFGVETTVSDGSLSVQGSATVDMAQLSGIEVLRLLGCSGGPTPIEPNEPVTPSDPSTPSSTPSTPSSTPSATPSQPSSEPSTSSATAQPSNPTAPAPAPAPPAANGFHGWASGVSGNDSAEGSNGSFSAWRGSKVGVVGTWNDATIADQTNMWANDKHAGFQGDLEVAVGGFDRGDSSQSYSAAASGAYDAQWRAGAKRLAAQRKDSKGITYIRPWHEFNGDWYKGWYVTPDRVEDYKKAFRRLVGIYRAELPGIKITWNPNDDPSSGAAPPEQSYPGDDVVDVIGVDSYDANAGVSVTDESKFPAYSVRSKNGSPSGVETWRLWAQKHGKPLSLPEWGLNHSAGGGDSPAYIISMNKWMTQHAAKPGDASVAGKIVYDIYFNEPHGGGFMIKESPNAANTYRQLKWGTWAP